MKLLALDTSSLACAVGVMHGDRIVTRSEARAREHTKLLLPMIRESLAAAELDVADLDAIVLGNGPGSFIGLRIAASVAQGLAHGIGVDIVPVSSMAAVAAAAAGPAGATIAVAQDAHMRQVYFGLYRLHENGLPEAILAERLQSLQAVGELDEYDDVIAAGEGWHRHPGLTGANRHRLTAISPVRFPTPEALLDIGAAAFAGGVAIRPERVDPVYLRDKVAKKQRP